MLDVLEKIKDFKPRSIMVIGDIYLDKYTYGICTGLAEEAPVVVLAIDRNKTIYLPGGAANIANNVRGFGSTPYLIGLVGQDDSGLSLEKALCDSELVQNDVIYSEHHGTIVKDRKMDSEHGKMLLREDHNDHNLRGNNYQENLQILFDSILSAVEGVIISDKGKATLSDDLIKYIVGKTKVVGKRIILDPRPEYTTAYENAQVISLRYEEAIKMFHGSGFLKEAPETLARNLSERLNSNIVINLESKGLVAYDLRHGEYYEVDGEIELSEETEVINSLGSGDSVSAALAVGLLNGLNLEEALTFANHAKEIELRKAGAKPVSLEEVVHSLV